MAATNERLDVGIVGAGKISSSAHLPVLANADWAKIRYIADVDESQVKALARSYDTKGVTVDNVRSLPACDAVLLATPVGVREDYIEEFGRRGTPVFSEKPFAPDRDTHEAFVDAVDTISCNYLRLCFSSTRQLCRLVETGVFGAVERVECSEGGIVGATGRSQGDYRTDSSLSGGGLLMERGSHMTSQLLAILGVESFTVEHATMIEDDGYDVDVDAELIADTERGTVPISFDLSRVRPVPNHLRVEFERATVRMPIDAPDGQVTIEQDGETLAELASLDRWATTFAQSAYLRWRQFRSNLVSEEYTEEIATAPGVTDLIASFYEQAEVQEL